MIQTLQRRFIVTAMAAVTALLLLLLGAINLFNAVSSSAETDQLLDMLASFEDFGPAPLLMQEGAGPVMPERGQRGFFGRAPDEDDRLAALTFTLRFDGEGALLSANTERIASVTDEEAEALGRQALARGTDSGRIGTLKYKIVQPAEDCRTVVFLDVGNQRDELLRVLALSALGGALAWLAMLGLVSALSKRAIRPIAENIERQRQFVTDAGHELKTPLAIIQANLDALELRGGENKYSRNIRGQTLRLSALMQNLLTLARLDENSKAPNFAPVAFSELCRESAEMFRASAEGKGIGLESDIPPEITVTGSRTLLQQLLSTLLDNAVKYCPVGGAIQVKLRREDRCVLTVSNTVGPERPSLERLFDRFYRADSSRNQSGGGFGIGLSAAQAILQLHKGEIGASYRDDRIVFTVRL